MTKFKKYIIAALIFFGAVFELSAAIPSKPDRLVNDLAGCMPAKVADSLERVLVAFDDSTSNQICVLTVKTLDGMASSDYAIQTFNKWGVGSKENNNGVLILVKPKTETEYGDVFIATGYGLEGALPDAVCSRIINKIMIPHFKQDDYSGAITEACETIMGIASGEYTLDDEDSGSNGHPFLGFIIIIGIIALIVFIFIKAVNEDNNNLPPGGGGSNHNRPYRRTRWVVGPGSFGGGSSSGGFGGGFGGFGGGLSGGGGAGGRW